MFTGGLAIVVGEPLITITGGSAIIYGGNGSMRSRGAAIVVTFPIDKKAVGGCARNVTDPLFSNSSGG